MRLKKFKEYSNFYSKDPKNFERKIVLATPNARKSSIFETVSNFNDLLQVSKDIPVIAWNDFNLSSTPKINENFCSTVYNQTSLPNDKEIPNVFKEEPFIPKINTDRSLVKTMKFPIIGVSDNSEDEFKTYGQFKKSENSFTHFKEKLIPTSRFEVLASGESPIHVQKKINQTSFDVDTSRWKHLGEAGDICKKIDSKYSPEFYSITLLESNGKLYLESINRKSDLTPSQEAKLYESAYKNYYGTHLPSWFRTKLFEEHVKPYYIKKYYDSLLFKPSGVIDYKKYVD
jgi:hypothetical protein